MPKNAIIVVGTGTLRYSTVHVSITAIFSIAVHCTYSLLLLQKHVLYPVQYTVVPHVPCCVLSANKYLNFCIYLVFYIKYFLMGCNALFTWINHWIIFELMIPLSELECKIPDSRTQEPSILTFFSFLTGPNLMDCNLNTEWDLIFEDFLHFNETHVEYCLQ